MDSEAQHAEKTALWEAPGCAVAVEYSRAVLDEIRREVLESFYAFRRGGAESGGVLFGSRLEGQVRIAAHRPLRCEHATGPSFVLSPNDRERLGDLLRAPVAEPELAGLVPVGWYHSHTRSGIFLSAEDLELHERYFREPWQVALVVRPSLAGTRAGFFARNPEGAMPAEASLLEFDVEPLAGRALARPASQDDSPPAPAAEEEPAPAPAPVEAPRFLLPAPRPPLRRLRRVAIALAAVALLAAAALAVRKVRLPPARPALPEGVALTPLDSAGHLRIRWNREAPEIRQAVAGTLEIAEAPGKFVTALDAARLRAGSFVYLRRTGRVDVLLRLEQPDGTAIEERAGFAGATPDSPAAAETELRRRCEDLELQLRQARTEMLNQALLIRKLQQETPPAAPAAEPATR